MPRGEEHAGAAVVPFPEASARRGVEAIKLPVPRPEYQFPVRERRAPLRLSLSVVVTPEQFAAAQVYAADGADAQPDVERAAVDEPVADDGRGGRQMPPSAACPGVEGPYPARGGADDHEPVRAERGRVERVGKPVPPHFAPPACVLRPQYAL